MFNFIPLSNYSFDTRADPDCTHDADPDLAGLHPDAGSLLAAVGMPAHAIRELLASQGRTRRGRLKRVKGRL